MCNMARKAPINMKKLLDLVANLGEERDLPVAINLVFDVTANDKLVEYVLNTFMIENELCTVNSSLLKDKVLDVPVPSDLTIIVGGTSILLGDVAACSRAKGTPAVVLSSKGEISYTESSKLAHEIAHVDNEEHEGIYIDDLIEIDVNEDKPLNSLATWIMENVSAKRIAMAKHFEFMRHPLSTELIQSAAIQNGAIGVVVFVPGADMPLITLNQARLVLQIALIYGNLLDRARIKEIAAVIASAFCFRAISRELTEFIPGVGFLIKAGVAYSGTLAIGYTALDYFAQGGVVAGLAEKLKESANAVIETTVSEVSRGDLSEIGDKLKSFTNDERIDEILRSIEYDKRD